MSRTLPKLVKGRGIRTNSDAFGGVRVESSEFASRRRRSGEWGSSVGSRRREVAVVLYGEEKRG